MESKLELLLHPIRIRIIMSVAGRQLTPQQIAATMPDVSQTTLYRHINLLVEGHIMAVVEERQVRGTVERSYALREGAALVDRSQTAEISQEDQLRYFMIFISTVLQDFTTFLSEATTGAGQANEVLYNKVALYLTETEQQHLIAQIRALLLPYTTENQSEPRKRYLFTSIAIPDNNKRPLTNGDTP